jgi:nucleobindin
LKSFFALHDLDSNGVLDASEIEAIYGVHHTESQKKSPDEAAHAAKARTIVQQVLEKMDTNRDGVLSPEEFEAAGFEGLPDFSSLGAEGHHYDQESEFFLHHEGACIPATPSIVLTVSEDHRDIS